MVVNDFLLFKWRKDLIKNLIEEEGNHFFYCLDRVANKFCRSLLLQVVCSAKADVFEFISYIHSNYNLFSKNKQSLTSEKINKMFKFIAFYNVLHILDQKENEKLYFDLEDALYTGLDCSIQERDAFTCYFTKYKIDRTLFEVEFSNDFIKELFENEKMSHPILAFISNFFYNSYKSFILSCEFYVAGY